MCVPMHDAKKKKDLLVEIMLRLVSGRGDADVTKSLRKNLRLSRVSGYGIVLKDFRQD
jgi:hypothetical protein